MRRDTAKLSAQTYDLAIIGGGIYGVCAAWEAVLRGLSVALIERGDFGGATSANSLHTIHGGLRYLQHLDFRRMRESIRERRAWMRLAPDLIKPMPFVLPTYGHGLRGREVMTIALAMNDLVAIDRNRGLSKDEWLPRGGVLSREKAASAFKPLRVAGFNGAALWYDGFNSSPERLLLALLRAAHVEGAHVANYVAAIDLLEQHGSICGIMAKDCITGHEFEIRSRCVLNAAGPWVDSVIARTEGKPRSAPSLLFRPSKALNLIVRRLPLDLAVGIPVPRQGRDADALFNKGSVTYFIIPWGNYSLIGTKHLKVVGDPGTLRIDRDEIGAFLEEINPALGDLRLDVRHVVAVKSGLLPEQSHAATKGDVELQKHPSVVDHEIRDGIPGMVSVIGVKWTTARIVAERLVQLICEKLRHCQGAPAMRTRVRAFSAVRSLQLDASAANQPDAATQLVDDAPVTRAQITCAARDEMAVKLADAVFRRTPLALSELLDVHAIRQCAQLMRRELDWSDAETTSQIQSVQAELDKMREWRA